MKNHLQMQVLSDRPVGERLGPDSNKGKRFDIFRFGNPCSNRGNQHLVKGKLHYNIQRTLLKRLKTGISLL